MVAGLPAFSFYWKEKTGRGSVFQKILGEKWPASYGMQWREFLTACASSLSTQKNGVVRGIGS